MVSSVNVATGELSILSQPLRQYFKPNEHDIYQTKGNTNDINDEKHSNRRRLDYYAGITCVIFFIAFGPIYIYHALRCFDIDIPMNQCYLVDQWLKMLPWLRKGFKIVLIYNSSLFAKNRGFGILIQPSYKSSTFKIAYFTIF